MMNHKDPGFYIFGHNGYGRMGVGKEEKEMPYSKEPLLLDMFSSWHLEHISCGAAHNVVVAKNKANLENTEMFTWGKCHFGQLGHGEMDVDLSLPTPLPFFHNKKIKVLGAGTSHVACVLDDERGEDSLYAWGVGYFGCLGTGNEKAQAEPTFIESAPKGIVKIVGGDFFFMVLTKDGKIFSTGDNRMGQLGINSSAKAVKVFTEIGADLFEGDKKDEDDVFIVDIACAGNFSLAVSRSGILYGFGTNGDGQLGSSEFGQLSNVPKQIFNDKDFPIEKAFAGMRQGFGLVKGGKTLICLGDNRCGQLGVGGRKQPKVPLQSLSFTKGRILDMACGENHTVFIVEEDNKERVYLCGESYKGKLATDQDLLIPNKSVHFQSGKIEKVLAGSNHTIVIQKDVDDNVSFLKKVWGKAF